MQIGHLMIGENHPPVIIAEIGINHNGKLQVAKEMVKAAVDAGADIIKHQTHFVDDEMTPEAKTVFPPNDPRSIWDIMDDCSLSEQDEVALKSYTELLGCVYISTPFSRKAADFLNQIGVPAFKIGSGEVSNIALVRHIASFGKPIIMSTGMHSIDTIRTSVQVLIDSGVEFALLECTNLYPSPASNVSLSGITELQKAFNKANIGFSDHSIGPYMALASIALGACIIERHFTDSRYRKGPDIICSMDPAELRLLKDRSHEIFTALHNKRGITAEEVEVYNFARSSIVADTDLPKNHKIVESDIWARRPGSGEIPGFEFDMVVGKTTRNPIRRNQQLKWTDII